MPIQLPRYCRPLILCLLGVGSQARADEPALCLMSYNIRLDTDRDGENRWDLRKEQLAAQIASTAPDVLGIQEGLPQQVDFLQNALTEYAFLGVGRDDGAKAGEHSALFYRTDRVRLLDSGTFWLSETPNAPSFGWGAAHRRICTYARFKDKTSQATYWVFNTHFDHEAAEARLNGANLILDRMKRLARKDEPAFLMGDLNATPSSPPIERIKETLADARDHSPAPPFGSEGTFNGFDPSRLAEERIDYQFFKPDTARVLSYAVRSDLVNQRYLSDHFPVVVRYQLLDR
ncbi:endonuclease/exonuclease/phosphatase family protein [Pelagicoccus sp. SDUM812003]|uniref:endonuclease/exonuclease/phosphatase family protein n=1 Tax=Pelagicoccus sp. SDUM812003 TaxID=3041267 RepID=UPI0028107690|nr:endonuclease/exonuclease/phosphatase family protein [Pelagicoccus sp. SDUM812003]MDQ8205244.1 endonuclease/exonuclease/phosphatase family protein [Pelagicoccus sp. SDUM812003]